MGNEAAIKNELLSLIKGFNFRFLKGMLSTFHGEVGKGVDNLAIVLQKVLIKVAEAEE